MHTESSEHPADGRIWRWAALCCLAGGLALSAPLVEPGAAVLLLLTGAVLGTLGYLLGWAARESGSAPGLVGWRPLVRSAAWTALGLLAFVGLSEVSGWGATVVATTLGVCSPPARRLTSRLGSAFGADVVGDVGAMSSVELCTAWRRTSAWLDDATQPATVVDIAVARHALLDELERRHPHAVQSWLQSDAVTGVGPERFLELPPAA